MARWLPLAALALAAVVTAGCAAHPRVLVRTYAGTEAPAPDADYLFLPGSARHPSGRALDARARDACLAAARQRGLSVRKAGLQGLSERLPECDHVCIAVGTLAYVGPPEPEGAGPPGGPSCATVEWLEGPRQRRACRRKMVSMVFTRLSPGDLRTVYEVEATTWSLGEGMSPRLARALCDKALAGFPAAPGERWHPTGLAPGD